MKLSIIVAIASNGAIGKNNDLLWHLPEDLKRFKQITTGHPVIMGKNTWLSLPIKPLPNRTNIVLNREMDVCSNNCLVFDSIDSVMLHCKQNNYTECFIIGGAEVYKSFLPLANRLYITDVEKEYVGDVFFPTINFNEWKLVLNENHFSEKNNFNYSYKIYDRL